MSLDICHLTKLVDKVRRCRPVKTLVHEDCIFKCNPQSNCVDELQECLVIADMLRPLFVDSVCLRPTFTS